MGSALVLVTASGLAREVAAAARLTGSHKVMGFVDDDPYLVGRSLEGVPVLGGLDAVADYPYAEVLVCAGKGTTRRALVARLISAGLDATRFARFVHPGSALDDSCSVGAGSILLAGCVVTAAVRIGSHVVLMPNVTVTHDDVIENYATLCAGVMLGGAVRIGEAAYLGMGASVRENRTVGAQTTLGMGAAAVCDIPSGQTWAGVPARPLPETCGDPA
jgi:sugar O-acyltransferase (sialic acid O-acetyltransferase NeuD family)